MHRGEASDPWPQGSGDLKEQWRHLRAGEHLPPSERANFTQRWVIGRGRNVCAAIPDLWIFSRKARNLEGFFLELKSQFFLKTLPKFRFKASTCRPNQPCLQTKFQLPVYKLWSGSLLESIHWAWKFFINSYLHELWFSLSPKVCDFIAFFFFIFVLPREYSIFA